jgi:hypothetical protein
VDHLVTTAELRAEEVGLVGVGDLELFSLGVLDDCEVGLVADDDRDVVDGVLVDFLIVLLELEDGICVGEVVDVEDAVEVLQLSLLDELKDLESAGVPLPNPRITIVRLTIRWWFIFIFLKRSWKPVVGSISSWNFSLCLITEVPLCS